MKEKTSKKGSAASKQIAVKDEMIVEHVVCGLSSLLVTSLVGNKPHKDNYYNEVRR